MKRFFFSLIALSAVAVGCTQSAMLETPDLGGTEVSFSPYTGRTPESKATSIENVAGLANGGGFNVYCFLNQEGKEPTVYLDNEKVESKDNGSTWAYTNLIYWPTAEGSSLDFVAYSANGVGKGLSGVSEDGFTFTVANDIANQIDLLATAYQAGNTLAGGSSVTLKFHHLLSRVGFKIQASQTDDNRKIKITNLALKGKMPKVGTLTFADFTATGSESVSPVLSPSTAAKDYTDGYTLISTETEFASSTNVQDITFGNSGRYMMIMPHNNVDDDHYIEITYAIGTGSKYSTANTVELDLPSDFTFVAGRAYEFVLQISTSKLSFDIEEQPWDTDDYDNDADKDNNQDFPLEPQDKNAVTLGSAYVTSGTDVKIPITVNKESLHSVKIQYIPSDKTWDGAEEIKEIEVKEYSVGESKEFEGTFSSNTEYYYRASVKVTESSEETYYYPAEDSKLSFITYAQIATPTATDIEPFKCTLSASYTYPQGNLDIIAAGFCWNLGEATPTARPYKPDGTWNTEVYLNETKQPAVNGTITVAATQLSDGKKYTYRAYVINERGVISYSETRTFDTPVYIPDANGNDDPGTGDFTEGDEI